MLPPSTAGRAGKAIARVQVSRTRRVRFWAMTTVALIGYGYSGRTFHAPLIGATPGLELVVVCSGSPSRVHAELPDIVVVAAPDAALAAAEGRLGACAHTS